MVEKAPFCEVELIYIIRVDSSDVRSKYCNYGSVQGSDSTSASTSATFMSHVSFQNSTRIKYII